MENPARCNQSPLDKSLLAECFGIQLHKTYTFARCVAPLSVVPSAHRHGRGNMCDLRSRKLNIYYYLLVVSCSLFSVCTSCVDCKSAQANAGRTGDWHRRSSECASYYPWKQFNCIQHKSYDARTASVVCMPMPMNRNAKTKENHLKKL